MDELDRKIVQLLQDDATLSVREIGESVGLSATPCWRRIRNLEERGVLTKRVTLVDPAKINLGVSALVFIRTNEHNKVWLQKFVDGVSGIPEIIEAYRTSGEVDYVLKVLVPDLAAFDDFYKRLIDKVELYDVRSTFILEAVKHSTSLPLDYV
ncbi:MAG: Lrp/AsnC family transcriptional regulator [Acidimicrobiia bacterium]|nr:Lrp/AsnC family transcriptional regulator [Acidimicrobiia bacterium]